MDLFFRGASQFFAETQEEIRTAGVVVMGRRAYDMAEGDLTDYEYQVPIFVLTHQELFLV